jgi:hypothetical protein
MYRKLNNNATPREIAEVVNRVLDGGVNSVGSVTLTSGTETTLYDERIGYESVILFTARGTNEFNLPFVKSKGKQEAVLGHSADATGVTFDYVIFG